MVRTELTNELLLSNPRRLVSDGQLITIDVRSDNMHPFLVSGRDQAIIGSFEKLEKNDLVLAQLHVNQYALLRIIDIKGSRITLKGDGNRRRTQICNDIDIVGVAVTVIRKKRHWSCNGWGWKFYSWVWRKLSPIRPSLLAIYRWFP